jgi:hypothetical protein
MRKFGRQDSLVRLLAALNVRLKDHPTVTFRANAFNNVVHKLDDLSPMSMHQIRNLTAKNRWTNMADGVKDAVQRSRQDPGLHIVFLCSDGAPNDGCGMTNHELKMKLAAFPPNIPLMAIAVSFGSDGDISAFCNINLPSLRPTNGAFMTIPDDDDGTKRLSDHKIDDIAKQVLRCVTTFQTPPVQVYIGGGAVFILPTLEDSSRVSISPTKPCMMLIEHPPHCPDAAIHVCVRTSTLQGVRKSFPAELMSLYFTNVLAQTQMESAAINPDYSSLVTRLERWAEICAIVEQAMAEESKEVVDHRRSRVARKLMRKGATVATSTLRAAINTLRVQIQARTQVTAAMMTSFVDLSSGAKKRIVKAVAKDKPQAHGLVGQSADIVGDLISQLKWALQLPIDACEQCLECGDDLAAHVLDSHMDLVLTNVLPIELVKSETMCGHSALTGEESAIALVELLLDPQCTENLAKMTILDLTATVPTPAFFAQVKRCSLSESDPYSVIVKTVPGISYCMGAAFAFGNGKMVAPGRETVNATIPLTRGIGPKCRVAKLNVALASLAIKNNPAGKDEDLLALQLVVLASQFPPTNDAELSMLGTMVNHGIMPRISRWENIKELMDGLCTDPFETIGKRANQLLNTHKIMGLLISFLLSKNPADFEMGIAVMNNWDEFANAVIVHAAHRLQPKTSMNLLTLPMQLIPLGHFDPEDHKCQAAAEKILDWVDPSLVKEFWDTTTHMGNFTVGSTIEMLAQLKEVGFSNNQMSPEELGIACRKAQNADLSIFPDSARTTTAVNITSGTKLRPVRDGVLILRDAVNRKVQLAGKGRIQQMLAHLEQTILRQRDQQREVFYSHHRGNPFQRTSLNEAAFLQLHQEIPNFQGTFEELLQPYHDRVTPEVKWSFEPRVQHIEKIELAKNLCTFPLCLTMVRTMQSHLSPMKHHGCNFKTYITSWHKRTKQFHEGATLEQFIALCEEFLLPLIAEPQRQYYLDHVLEERFWQITALRGPWRVDHDLDHFCETTGMPTSFAYIYHSLRGNVDGMRAHIISETKAQELHFKQMEAESINERTCPYCEKTQSTFGHLAKHLSCCFFET